MTSYEWLSAREHALQRPDTYVGAITPTDLVMHAFEHADGVVKRRDISLHTSPALFKVSDEVIVNAIDNHRRDASQKYIRLTFASDGVFSVLNDGATIPIELWEETGRYIPEILFGELMSGENFDDTKARIGGGRNGIGVKIVNILAEWFEITLVNTTDNLIFHSVEQVSIESAKHMLSQKHPDQQAAKQSFVAPHVVAVGRIQLVGVQTGGRCTRDTLILSGSTVYRNVGALRYTQRFENNLCTTHPPHVTKTRSADKTSSTRVVWKVDLTRIGMTPPLHPDALELLKVRAYDAAACTASKLSIVVNETKVPFKCLKDYAMAMGGKWVGRDTVTSDTTAACIDVCVLTKDAGCAAACVGFVNGIRCSHGTHVDVVFKRLAEAVSEAVGKKLKRVVTVRSAQLKDYLVLVVSVLIVNPSFTSQTKEKLEVSAGQLGTTYVCSAKMTSGLERSGIIESLCEAVTAKDERAVHKSIKADKLRAGSIPKYEKALKLQSKHPCSLYITEGDSAKALVVAGFSVIGRDYNGVYPLRGKLVNVNGMSIKKALEHKEIMHLTQILGLDPHISYTTQTALAMLRYRHLVIFTDQDHDGSHIAGLVFNWLQSFYPTLLASLPDFVHRFATPIIRARVGADAMSFFSLPEYRMWLNGRTPTAVKYYKGLGTSDVADSKRYFENISNHRVVVRHEGRTCADAINTFFASSKVNERKAALLGAAPDSFVDYGKAETSIGDFCFKELVHYGIADNIRSLASAIDGLKPAQRKVLFSVLRRKPGEVKVGQLAASTSELTAYHHGEASLVQTLVAMAQPWMGANNVALLRPNGMFGSRHMPRTEHSAERYIFTEAHPVARYFFPAADDATLDMAQDDGRNIEPKVFCPVVAFLLINGSEGIGTGWKSSCPAYSALDVIENTRRLVTDPLAVLAPMTPAYNGFTGTIVANPPEYTFIGKYEIESDTCIRITELPPKQWTAPYIAWISEFLIGDGEKQFVVDVTDSSTHDTVNIIIKTKASANIREMDIVKRLRLSVRFNTNYLNLFDASSTLRKYDTPHDIMRAHAIHRRHMYRRRLAKQVEQAHHEHLVATNRARFVRDIGSSAVVPSQNTRESLRTWLASNDYYEHSNFDYLQIGIFSLTRDVARELDAEAIRLLTKQTALENTAVETVWADELNQLEKAVLQYRAEGEKKHEPGAHKASKRKLVDSTRASKKAATKK